MSLQDTGPNAFPRGETFNNTHGVGQLLTSSMWKAWKGLQTNITKRVVYVCECCNPVEKNNE